MNFVVFSISIIAIMMVYGYSAGRHHVNAGLWFRFRGHNIMIPYDGGIALAALPFLILAEVFAPRWWGLPAILVVSGLGAYLHTIAASYGAGFTLGIGMKRVSVPKSTESIAVNTLLSSLTEEQARTLFGKILTPNQVMILFDVASHLRAATALDVFFSSLAPQQLDAIQALFSTKQVVLFMACATKRTDSSMERSQ